ncbi:MAG: tetratricopeptide repeat-containing protein [Smithella sp.]
MPQPDIQEKKTCLVVQGFGEKTDLTDGRKLNLDASYQVIKEAVEEAGLKCLRADEIVHSGTIDVPMYEQILHADLVIADLSTYNANAAYELGVRYGLRPYATIIVAEEKFKNPFDFSHIVIHRYKHLGEDIGVSEARRFKEDLKEAIREIATSRKTDSPIYTFLSNLHPPVEEVKAEKLPEAASDSGLPEQIEQSLKALFDAVNEAKKNRDYALARTLLQVMLGKRPHDEYLVEQLVLATYKSKQPDEKTALEEALSILKTLNPESSNDPEVLGLWGALHKHLWEITSDPSNLEESIGAYERGYWMKVGVQEKGHYLNQVNYSGINLALLLNVRAALKEKAGEYAEAIADFIQARRILRELLRICRKALENGPVSESDRYWVLATMWEAAAGLEDYVEAAQWEQEARKVCSQSWIERTQLRLEKWKELLVNSPLKHLQV